MSEDTQWISIERLLDTYSIPILAEAIDRLEVQTIDAVGRKILATDGDDNDVRSKAFARRHLAQRRAFEIDPLTDDEQYFFELRIEIHGSALDLFGWPKDQLPNFTELQPDYRPDVESQAWTRRPFQEFLEEYKAAGSYTKAGEIHGVSRQRYTEIYKAKSKANTPFSK